MKHMESLALVLALAFGPAPAFAAVDTAEARLATASAKYHAQDFAAALAEADAALRLGPDAREARELRALALVGLGRTKDALVIYRDLARAHAERAGAYAFECGVLEMQTGAFAQAAEDFLSARKAGFNVEIAGFFLALARYRNKESSDRLFQIVAREAKDHGVVAAALFYRARLALENGGPANALTLLREARDSAERDPKSALSERVRAQIDAALAQSEESRLVAGLETTTEWDSNPVLLSSEASDGRVPGTMKQSLLAALAFGQDRGAKGAWSIALRSIFNYNFSKQTKTSEFGANEAEASALLLRIGSWRAGLLASGIYLFRNQDNDGGEKFRPYLVGGSAGVAAESTAGVGRWRVEATTGRANFKDDDDYDAELRRSGGTYGGSLGYRYDRERGAFNPSVRLEHARLASSGTEYRGQHTRLVVADQLYVGTWQWVAQVSATRSQYTERLPDARRDTQLAADVLGSRPLGRAFALLIRAGYAENRSSVAELYSYRRGVVGGGLRYLF